MNATSDKNLRLWTAAISEIVASLKFSCIIEISMQFGFLRFVLCRIKIHF